MFLGIVSVAAYKDSVDKGFTVCFEPLKYIADTINHFIGEGEPEDTLEEMTKDIKYSQSKIKTPMKQWKRKGD